MSLPLAGVCVLAVEQSVAEWGPAAEDAGRINACIDGGQGMAVVLEGV